jgi:hypothetical protein
LKVLHVTPGDSAAGSLIKAIREDGRDDAVLTSGHDDLSCGPIDPDDPSVRARWWAMFYDYGDRKVDLAISRYWERVLNFDGRIVVWFGRHSAQEMAFFLHWADRFSERPYYVIDVTGMKFPVINTDGSQVLSEPAKAISLVRSGELRSLLDTERLITDEESEDAQRQWRQLRKENSHFRIVVDNGLASAPSDFFDNLIMDQVTPEWRKVAGVIGRTMGENDEPYRQVDALMLQARIAVLIAQGKLLSRATLGKCTTAAFGFLKADTELDIV